MWDKAVEILSGLGVTKFTVPVGGVIFIVWVALAFADMRQEVQLNTEELKDLSSQQSVCEQQNNAAAMELARLRVKVEDIQDNVAHIRSSVDLLIKNEIEAH